MDSTQAAIAKAAECGITVEVTPGTEEGAFARASAHFTNDTTGKPCVCLTLEPKQAIAGAIDALVKKAPGTTLQ